MISQSVMRIEADSQSLRPALLSGVQRLSRAGIDTARLDAEVMLGHVLAMTREQVVSMSDIPLTGAQTQRYEATLRRRLEREPVAYITGSRVLVSGFSCHARCIDSTAETKLVRVA